MLKKVPLLAVLLAVGLVGLINPVSAAEGLAHPWQLSLQDPKSPVMEGVFNFHNLLLVVQFGIVGLVLAILAYCIIRFNAKRNPVPSRTSHNTLLEVIWTALPVVILIIIAIPGLRLLYFQDRVQDADMTLKVSGHQWYWSYSYPDHGKFEFDSLMLQDADRKKITPEPPRLLAVDNEMVVPANKTVRVITTGSDVIHAFAVPAFGIKIDSIPGRINETWFKATREGVYYGQCSELCGKDHAFMPIAVRVVSEQAFATWVEEAKKKYARDETEPPTTVAAAEQPTAR